MDRDRALKILGLAPGASAETIREAYRDLAKVWHPDRFPNDERLRAKANERLKEINEAYAALQRDPPISSAPPRSDAAGTPHWAPPPSGVRGASPTRPPVPSWVWGVGVTALLAGAGLAWISRPQPEPDATREAVDPPPPTPAAASALESPSATPRNEIAPAAAKPPASSDIPAASPFPEAPGRGTSWFTVGSTTDEVLAVQGKPKSYGEMDWTYGHSKVLFSAGRVVGWDVAPKSPLRVRLLPSRIVHPTGTTFTIGSTQDEVLAIQGTPTAFNENVWRYGESSVQFRDGRVVDWRTAPGAPLKATPHPEPPVREWYTIGATQDEVLRVQGKPDETQELRWRYRKSWLFFSGGRVTGWDVARKSPLRVRLLPHDAGVTASDFTFGSSADEVLAAQGTPDAFSDPAWRYGESTVYFADGRVTRWDARPDSPLRIRR